MSAASTFILAALALVAIILIVTYNRFVGLRLRIDESWANVDTELKRRHDLIPNLVETVRGYAKHERELLTDVARVRALAKAGGDTPERREGERTLAQDAHRVLVAVAEAYPELRAQENFMRLHRDLVLTEDRIQAARRFFNANVRDHNNLVEQFPSNLVANVFRFRTREYFELPSALERAAPSVEI